MKQNFIKTKDADTASLLSKHFKLLSNIDGEYTFVNCPTANINFEAIDSSKYIQTDTLSF